MGEYDRYAYEDLDEYEEDGIDNGEGGYGEEDEYEEEEKKPKPAKEILDYLELRQKLKEQKRKELRKEFGHVNGSSREKNLFSRDSFGSFFGPSQPVIAQRVIQESKSLLETASSGTKINKSSQSVNKISGSSLSRNPQLSGQKPRVPNLQHKKVEILKNTRDYSFLLSDDAEVPVPKTAPPHRNTSTPKPEMRYKTQTERSKGSVSISGRKDFSSREDKSSTAVDRNRLQPRLGTDRLSSGASQVWASMDSRKNVGATNGSLVDRKKQLSRSNSSGPVRPTLLKNVPPSSINGSGPGRPAMSRTVPPKVRVGASERKVNVPVQRSSAPSVQRPATSKPHPSVSRQPVSRKDEYLITERGKGRDEYQVREKPKVISKQSVPAPKPKQVIKPPPKNVARETLRDEHPRKRPLRHVDDDDDDDDDPQKALSMIRNMFRYNPRKYDNDSDDSDMEAGFDDIMREEMRSAKIARREDEEELRKIEEEERRERLRKEAKKRKLSNNR